MWGQIIGAVAGGILSNNAANKKSAAIDRMNEANMAGFRQYQPYVDSALEGGQGALNNVLNTGYYQGPTYAGPTAYQTDAANALGGAASGVMGYGSNLVDQASGFGDNTNALYDQFMRRANNATAVDRIAEADKYARSNAGGLVNAIMRDDTRNLQYNTLPGINRAASGSGNMNSSRAGIADALAQTAYDDRKADVTADVVSQLRDASLNQQNEQFNQAGQALTAAGNTNNQLGNVFTTGLNTLNSGFGMGNTAGGALQGYNQAAMNDARANFEGNRDFALSQYKDYMSGMLGRAPSTTNSTSLNAVDPTSKTIAGMTSGFGTGQQFMNNMPSFGNSSFFDGLFGGPGLGSFGG